MGSVDGGQTKTNTQPIAAKPPKGLRASALGKKVAIRRRAVKTPRAICLAATPAISGTEKAVLGALASERTRMDQAGLDAKADA
jgi:hypothetical protein